MRVKRFLIAGAAIAMVPAAALAEAPAEKLSPDAVRFEQSLHKQTGDVAVPGAKATLHLGDR